MLNKQENYERSWKWLLGLGILFVLLSFFCLSKVIGVTIVSILFIGIVFIIGGFAQLIDVFKSKDWQASIWHAICALLYVAIGSIIVYDPLLASSVLTIFIAVGFIIMGIVRLIMALNLKPSTPGWFFLIINSLMSIILGGVILAYWPMSSLLFIGMLITIELMVTGWIYIFLSIALSKRGK